MRPIRQIDPEVVIGGVLFLLAVLGFLFIGSLVAEPKLLFGRSLTAIAPSLFPKLVLAGLALLSALFLYERARQPGGFQQPRAGGNVNWPKAVLLFAIMTLYALTMGPFGFLLSSIVAITLISILAGNRNLLQIVPLAVIAPIALYLVSTRLLAVSLPELSTIEFAYARLLGETGAVAPLSDQ